MTESNDSKENKQGTSFFKQTPAENKAADSFSEGQKAELGDMLSTAIANALNSNKQEEAKPVEVLDIGKQVEANKESEARKLQEAKEQQGLIEFKLGLGTFVADNLTLLGDNAKETFDILDANKENYTIEEYNLIAREALARDFFKVESNLTLLPEYTQNEIKSFLQKTPDIAKKDASIMYTHMQNALHTKKNVVKQDFNSVVNQQSSSKKLDAYMEKISMHPLDRVKPTA